MTLRINELISVNKILHTATYNEDNSECLECVIGYGLFDIANSSSCSGCKLNKTHCNYTNNYVIPLSIIGYDNNKE